MIYKNKTKTFLFLCYVCVCVCVCVCTITSNVKTSGRPEAFFFFFSFSQCRCPNKLFKTRWSNSWEYLVSTVIACYGQWEFSLSDFLWDWPDTSVHCAHAINWKSAQLSPDGASPLIASLTAVIYFVTGPLTMMKSSCSLRQQTICQPGLILRLQKRGWERLWD